MAQNRRVNGARSPRVGHAAICESNREVTPIDGSHRSLSGVAVVTGSGCPANKKKHSSRRKANKYGTNSCANRMPLDPAQRKIYDCADREEGDGIQTIHFTSIFLLEKL